MKFVRILIGLVANNWWLKLVALLLAIIIYHSEKTDRTRNHDHSAHDRPLLQFR